MFNNNGISPADIAAVTGNGFGGGGWDAILAIMAMSGGGFGGFGGAAGLWPLLLLCGWGGFGGWGGNNGQCATQPEVRAAVDQQTLISKLDGNTYGIADLGYAMQNAINGVTNTVQNGFAQSEIGAANRQMQSMQQQFTDTITDLQSNFAIQQQINQNAVGASNNTRDILTALNQCCCDNAKTAMQANYDAQARHCESLTALDRLGDRIIGYMNNAEKQALHDEILVNRIRDNGCGCNNFGPFYRGFGTTTF